MTEGARPKIFMGRRHKGTTEHKERVPVVPRPRRCGTRKVSQKFPGQDGGTAKKFEGVSKLSGPRKVIREKVRIG